MWPSVAQENLVTSVDTSVAPSDLRTKSVILPFPTADPQKFLGMYNRYTTFVSEQFAMQQLGTCLDSLLHWNIEMRQSGNWLVDVAMNYRSRFLVSVLYGASYQQYLVRRFLPWRQLLLVGFATMLLASKSKEICLPKVQDFVHFTDALTFPGSLLRALRPKLGRREGSLHNVALTFSQDSRRV